MDIAAMSTMLNQAKVQQQASISVMKMAMDTGETQMNELVKTMEQSVNPNLGKNLDISL